MPIPLPAVLTAWQFEPLSAVPLTVLAVCYLIAAGHCGRRRAGARGPDRHAEWRRPVRPWPARRTLAFLAGLGVIAVATQGWAGMHDDTELAAHMAQHLLLLMVAPPLLVAGRPVTLLLHTAGNPWHSYLKRIVRSPGIAALTWPPAGVLLYSAVVPGTHLSWLVTATGAVHDAGHVLYVLTGYLFFLPVIGSEPTRWRTTALGRYLLLLAALPANIATGAALLLHGPVGGYDAVSVCGGGLVMLVGGDLIMAALATAVAVKIVSGGAFRRFRSFPYAGLGASDAGLASLNPDRAPGV